MIDDRDMQIFQEYMTTPSTEEEVGEKFGLSRIRVHQIVAQVAALLGADKKTGRGEKSETIHPVHMTEDQYFFMTAFMEHFKIRYMAEFWRRAIEALASKVTEEVNDASQA